MPAAMALAGQKTMLTVHRACGIDSSRAKSRLETRPLLLETSLPFFAPHLLGRLFKSDPTGLPILISPQNITPMKESSPQKGKTGDVQKPQKKTRINVGTPV